jgi:acetoin utilization protein AcuB
MAQSNNVQVRDLISKQQLIVVSPKETLEKAFAVMLKYNIRHLPAVDDQGELVGMISDRDIRLAADSPILNKGKSL